MVCLYWSDLRGSAVFISTNQTGTLSRCERFPLAESPTDLMFLQLFYSMVKTNRTNIRSVNDESKNQSRKCKSHGHQSRLSYCSGLVFSNRRLARSFILHTFVVAYQIELVWRSTSILENPLGAKKNNSKIYREMLLNDFHTSLMRDFRFQLNIRIGLRPAE